jgi:hypothetical protein
MAQDYAGGTEQLPGETVVHAENTGEALHDDSSSKVETFGLGVSRWCHRNVDVPG